MLKQNYQYQISEYKTHVLDLPDADIQYWPEFIQPTAGWQLYSDFVENIHWQQERICLYGKTHDVPRLSCWVADSGLDYGYSNIRMQAQPWSEQLSAIKQKIRNATAQEFNSVLLNYYRDGQDSNGWHSDDEKELGRDPVIASLSLGADRDFHLRHKIRKELKQSISLEHASLLLMKGPTQHYWQHHIPKRARAEGRINLTFRTVLA